MKKLFLAIGLLVAALLISNPNLAAHRSALLEKEFAGMAEAGLDPGSPLAIGSIKQTVERRTGARNYFLFSLTTVNYSDTLPASAPPDLLNRTIGVGILGKVYLWSTM